MWEALWASVILFSFWVGFGVIWRKATSKGKSQLLRVLTLLLFGLGALFLRIWLGDGELDVGLYAAKSLAALAVASLMILVLDHLPQKVPLSSSLFGRVMMLVPLLVGDILVTIGPFQLDVFVQIFRGALILCGLMVGGLTIAGFKELTPLLMGEIVSLTACFFVLIGSYVAEGALIVARTFPFPTIFLDALGSLSAFSFIIIFSPFAGAYRFMEIEPQVGGCEEAPRANKIVNSVSRGSTYFFETFDEAMRVFSELLLAGFPALCVTRQYPERVRQRLGLRDVPVVWVTRETSVPEALGSSNISIAGAVILSFLERAEGSVILFDGFEYLVTNNGFDVSLKYLYDLKDKVTSQGSVLLMPLDLNCFDERQRALLERDVRVLKAS